MVYLYEQVQSSFPLVNCENGTKRRFWHTYCGNLNYFLTAICRPSTNNTRRFYIFRSAVVQKRPSDLQTHHCHVEDDRENNARFNRYPTLYVWRRDTSREFSIYFQYYYHFLRYIESKRNSRLQISSENAAHTGDCHDSVSIAYADDSIRRGTRDRRTQPSRGGTLRQTSQLEGTQGCKIRVGVDGHCQVVDRWKNRSDRRSSIYIYLYIYIFYIEH